jgi:MFS family permease
MVVLALVNLVDQADIAILRGVLPILEDEWSLSDLQLGLLGFVFVFLNALTTIPAGWLADHTRRTRLIGWTLLSWTGLIALSATAVNYVNLLGARAVMGIGQAVDDPASTSLVGDYYPSRLRARAFSLQQVSLFVGGGIGLALGGFVGETLGWRWAFALVGMPARSSPCSCSGSGSPCGARPTGPRAPRRPSRSRRTTSPRWGISCGGCVPSCGVS